MKSTFAVRTLCSTLILSIFIMTPSFAYYPQQNHVYTTTTTESYSASSPVGKFENNSTQGAIAPIYTTYNNYTPYPVYSPQPMYAGYSFAPNGQISYLEGANATPTNDNSDLTKISSAAPVSSYGYNTPVYSAGVGYANPNYSSNYSSQDIETPQTYEKTVTTAQEYVDTRERADKIIDRGSKILGSLALVGAVTGLIMYAAK